MRCYWCLRLPEARSSSTGGCGQPRQVRFAASRAIVGNSSAQAVVFRVLAWVVLPELPKRFRLIVWFVYGLTLRIICSGFWFCGFEALMLTCSFPFDSFVNPIVICSPAGAPARFKTISVPACDEPELEGPNCTGGNG